ncbi:MAG: DNA-binding protein WhiA [Clostridia bacterium]|nr:DNA-binding protein WhiA [Clostridia bacterium]
MSLSSEVKQELVALHAEKSCCMFSELNALTQCCASMTLHGRGQVSIVYTTENVSVAKRIFILLKKSMEINSTPHFTKIRRFGGRRVCRIQLSIPDTRKLMYALHMLHESESGDVFRGIPRRALSRKCCQQAFLRGAFLGVGSIATPEHNHHLEFVCGNESRADSVAQLLRRNDLECRTEERRGAAVVYMKKGAQISTLLGLMGATRAMMRYENILAQRSLRENVMRATNCDHNNTVRQLNAAQKQIETIMLIKNSSHFSQLPEELRQVAELRIQHPESSMEEIGTMLSPPLGKSGVNHRFRKIACFSQEKEIEAQGEEHHVNTSNSTE